MRVRAPLSLTFCVVLAACASRPDDASSVHEAALSAPRYVQGTAATPHSTLSAMTVTLPSAQTAGNLVVAIVGWNDTIGAVTSVTDSRGDTFALAVGPTKYSTRLSQSIYYARNVAGGTNTVTVQFSPAATNVDVRVLEYAGLDRTAPLDAAAGASGIGATAASGNLTTTAAGDLLVAGDMVATGSLQAGPGYTARIVTSPDDDIAEDEVAGASGTYSATAPVQAPEAWVMQVAAFKVAASPSDGGAGGSGAGGGASGSGGGAGGGGGSGRGGAGGRGASGSGGGGASGRGGSGGGGAGGGGASGRGGSGSGASSGGGAGGSGGGCATFPLHASADARTLLTTCGTPFLVAGDSPQCLSANLSPASMDGYFAGRAAHGFNAAWVNVLCTTYTGGRTDATTYDGIVPFTGTVSGGSYDLTKPNPTYFARIDAMVAAAAAHGILLFLDPIEFGGFYGTMIANSEAACTSYGQFLGARYKGSPNIVWMHGNDMAGFNQIYKVSDISRALAAAGATQLQTAELDWPALSSTLDDADFVPPNAPIGINESYTYNPTYALMLHDYHRSPHLPNVMIEANYEGENNENGPHVTNAHDTRTQDYWTALSGATGFFYGSFWEVHALDNATWSTNMANDVGATQTRFVRALFEPRAWSQLVPDDTHVVVTSGLGTCMAATDPQGRSSLMAMDNSCATSARTADGTLVVSYMPSARTVTVDMSKLSMPAAARWFDPTTGGFTTISGSPFANSGTRTFTPPTGAHTDGYTDWALVLEKP